MRLVFSLLVLALVPSMSLGQGTQSPTRLYDGAAQSKYLLDQCGELTPARREWLHHLVDQAKKRLDWTADRWAAHDAVIAADLQRTFPRPPSKERCAEIARLIDSERKVLIRD